MDVRSAKRIVRDWILTNEPEWPGLRAAHLVGGITTMADDAVFPTTKDVDVHLIFDDGVAGPPSSSAFAPILEAMYGGVMIEAGIKPISDYASPEIVLGNPEIAHHLLVDSVLFDPDGLLDDLMEPVRRHYPRRKWVQKRIDHERAGHAAALGMVPMVRDAYGNSGELNIMGYATTFLVAAVGIARLQPPRLGSKAGVRLHEHLSDLGRLDLQERMLDVFGVREFTPDDVRGYVIEAGAAFDLALDIKRTPHFFEHKLQRHLRPYFIESACEMIESGHHREAMMWLMAGICASTDVIVTDGSDEERAVFADRRQQMFEQIGFVTDADRASKWAKLHRLTEDLFTLAENVMWDHPQIVEEVPVARVFRAA